MCERVCFIFYDRQKVFKHTYMLKRSLHDMLLMFFKAIRGCMLERVCFIFHDRQRVFKYTCTVNRNKVTL